MYDYFYGQQAELFSFYRVPKVLFTDEKFSNISSDAKLLYGIMLDRMNLSAKNGWVDELGRVYIIFTIEEIKGALGCAEKKAVKLLHELENKCGLIERKRIGLGKPNYIYVKNFVDHLCDLLSWGTVCCACDYRGYKFCFALFVRLYFPCVARTGNGILHRSYNNSQ